MRIRSRVLPLIAATALLAAACDSADDVEEADDEVEETDEDQSEDDGEDAADADEADDEADDEASDDDGESDDEGSAEDDDGSDRSELMAGGVDSLEVAESDLGEHIVDGEGNTLYVNVLEEGEPMCVADCATVWPALGTDGEPEVSDDLDADLVDSVERDDGITQVTYDGRPLYLFVSDEPGETGGQGLNDTWFVLGADGEPLGDVPDEDELEELRGGSEDEEE
ncbi:MAG: hypothetical protein ACLFRD_01150 [Nitriliruptoraceae bacterium]